MPCKTCQSAIITTGLWAQYDSPKCLYCTARLIQKIGKCRSPTSEQITKRRQVVLADAVAWGHSEMEIRDLAALKDLAYEPAKER